MQAKRLLKSGLVFLLVFAVLYFPALVFMCKVNFKSKPLIYKTSDIYTLKGGNSYRKFKEFDKNAKCDLIVVGSSHAYRGYDPRNFSSAGISMFNLGTSAQTPLNSYIITKNYVTNGNCKLVILDVYDGAFHNNGFESSSDLIQNISSNKAAFEMATSYKNPQILNMLALRFINSSSPVLYQDSLYKGCGYSEKRDTLKYSLPFDEYENRYLPSDVQIEYLEKLLQYFTTNNIPVIMVTVPFPKEKIVEQHIIYSKIFTEMALKYKVQYLDYSFNNNFNSKTHFYDSHHLNQSGVNLFNKIFLDDLDKMDILKKLHVGAVSRE